MHTKIKRERPAKPAPTTRAPIQDLVDIQHHLLDARAYLRSLPNRCHVHVLVMRQDLTSSIRQIDKMLGY